MVANRVVVEPRTAVYSAIVQHYSKYTMLCSIMQYNTMEYNTTPPLHPQSMPGRDVAPNHKIRRDNVRKTTLVECKAQYCPTSMSLAAMNIIVQSTFVHCLRIRPALGALLSYIAFFNRRSKVRENFDGPNFTIIDTMFSLAEAYIFLQLVEFKDAHPDFEVFGVKSYLNLYS